VGGRTTEAVDPDDLPYKVTCEELGADAVYSRDAHLRTMKVPLISGSPDLILRNYARSSSVVMGVTLGSGITLTISFASLRGVYCLIEKTVSGFRSLPTWAKIGIAAVAVAIVSHPKSRAKLIAAWHGVCNTTKAIGPTFLSVVAEIATQFLDANQVATQAHTELQSVLPKPRRRSAIQHVRSICLISKNPLSVSEIENFMRKAGYITRSKNFGSYIQRLLRENKQFVEAVPGKWSLQTI
jgi:hypothetical protein